MGYISIVSERWCYENERAYDNVVALPILPHLWSIERMREKCTIRCVTNPPPYSIAWRAGKHIESRVNQLDGAAIDQKYYDTFRARACDWGAQK